MTKHEITIEFPEVSAAQAGRYAAELHDVLKQAADDISVERIRSDPEAQDFGTILVVIFGTRTAIVLARALGRWLERRSQAKIRIITDKGIVCGKNIDSKDVPAIVRALTQADQQP